MARVFFTRAARDDLIEIWTHIAEDDPAAAGRVLGSGPIDFRVAA